MMVELASLLSWDFSELKTYFTVKLQRSSRIPISPIYKEPLVELTFHLVSAGKHLLR